MFCSPSRAFSEKEGGLENVCVYARHPYWAALWYAPFVMTPVRKLWSSLLCQSKSWRGWVKIGQSPIPSLRRLPGLTLAPRLASARTRFCVWVRWKCHHFFSRLTQPRGMLSWNMRLWSTSRVLQLRICSRTTPLSGSPRHALLLSLFLSLTLALAPLHSGIYNSIKRTFMRGR